MVVVLPEPFGPRKPVDLAGLDRKVQTVQGPRRSEVLGET